MQAFNVTPWKKIIVFTIYLTTLSQGWFFYFQRNNGFHNDGDVFLESNNFKKWKKASKTLANIYPLRYIKGVNFKLWINTLILLETIQTADKKEGIDIMAGKKKIVIIGGVAGGATAAARLRRLSAVSYTHLTLPTIA